MPVPAGEVRQRQAGHGVQCYVETEERNESKGRVQHRQQTEDGQRREDDGERAAVQPRVVRAALHGNADRADDDVEKVVQHVDREQAEQEGIERADDQGWSASRRRLVEAGDEAQHTDGDIDNTEHEHKLPSGNHAHLRAERRLLLGDTLAVGARTSLPP